MILKYLHHILDKIILSLIGRSCTILTDIEPRIQKELSYLPDNFTAAVAVEKDGLYIVIKKSGTKIKYYGYTAKSVFTVFFKIMITIVTVNPLLNFD